MNHTDAERFAAQWVTAWNAHDLEGILAHYADDIELYSPAIVKVMGEPSGVLRGKDKVRAYWAHALDLFPDLRFELRETLLGGGFHHPVLCRRSGSPGGRGELSPEPHERIQDGDTC